MIDIHNMPIRISGSEWDVVIPTDPTHSANQEPKHVQKS